MQPFLQILTGGLKNLINYFKSISELSLKKKKNPGKPVCLNGNLAFLFTPRPSNHPESMPSHPSTFVDCESTL